MILKLYFILFNLVSAAGWAFCGIMLLKNLAFFPDGAKLWESMGTVLMVTQSLAIMETVHVLIGFVRGSVFQSMFQVGSRIFLIWAVLVPSEKARAHWSLYTLMVAYVLTETVRYTFYAIRQVSSRPPAPLFHLRYNMFYVLYPMGITSEVLLILQSVPADFKNDMFKNLVFANYCSESCISGSENLVGCGVTLLLMIIYALLSIPMIMAMHFISKAAYRKRYPRKPKMDRAKGILFPLINGQRSTQEAGKSIICTAITAGKPIVPVAAAKARIERSWRFKYIRHFKAMFEACLETPQDAVAVAKAGAECMHQTFDFRRPDKEIIPFKEEMKRTNTCFKGTFRIDNTDKKDAVVNELTVPYKSRDNNNPLKGKEIIKLADKWAKYGTIEPDAAEAIKLVTNNPEWLKMPNTYFVLIGAGSAMGPFLKLMEIGANVIALDIPGKWEKPNRPSVWRRLMKVARVSGGKMIFPLSKPASECKDDDDIVQAAGANLLEQPADILNWLMNLEEVKNPKNRIVVGNYTYLDGALHVKLSLCADAIMKEVAARRPTGKTTLAYLCTPTDLHVITKEACKQAESNLNNGWIFNPIGAMIESFLRTVSGGKYLRSNVWKNSDQKQDFDMVNGLINNQGPNYALAKRLQHWRAVLAYEAGVPVSTNIAPSTATKSVVSATTFKWAYGGIPYFKPYEIFDQDTTNAVMTAALINDIQNPNSAANPKNRGKGDTKVTNPMELFKYTSFHGGVWRSAYTMDSLGVTSVLIYFLGGPKLFVPVVIGIAGALSAATYSVATMTL
ncbi:hypothetical protein AAMO2058_000915800 [Amorphochlora amoebiformis]